MGSLTDGSSGSCCLSFLSARKPKRPAPEPSKPPEPASRQEEDKATVAIGPSISFKQVAQDAKRTSNSLFRCRCSERHVSNSLAHPVKLIVFDFDETLSLVTLMTPDGTLKKEHEEWAITSNFETPWVSGSRIAKLDKMFRDLVDQKDGHQRSLAILTRNGNPAGVSAVVSLLRAAKLDHHFVAMWTLPRRSGRWNGAYQDQGNWKPFAPPGGKGQDHKAHVLQEISDNPEAWFPQMKEMSGDAALPHLAKLEIEDIVLVDDQRANFQSTAGAMVLRYCKVARYDATYREFGLMRDMGGIGAHDDADYDSLKRFVEDPWMCKETFQLRCQEREYQGQEAQKPVTLVIFDFDETLTMATFMPDDPDFTKKFGWSSVNSKWSKDDLIEYNFESPFSPGCRVHKLRETLKAIICPNEAQQRTLAILTRNEHGAVAVLNLLQLAGLADNFSAIWATPAKEGRPNGVFRAADDSWQIFDPPLSECHAHKADIVHHIAKSASAWFPQFAVGCSGPRQCAGLQNLCLEGIVLVDDERANFRSGFASEARVLRYCKVARYDEKYRECGILNQLGGLGSHHDADYEVLKLFIEKPWEFPYETVKQRRAQVAPKQEQQIQEKPANVLRQSVAELESPKAPRRRAA